MKSNSVPLSPPLTNESALQTLVENRTVYNLENCELNLFETYESIDQVPLLFNDLIVSSMTMGRKVVHLFELPSFEYVPGESVIVPPKVPIRVDFPDSSFENPTQCIALALEGNKITETLNFLNEKYPKEGHDNFWQLDWNNFIFKNNVDLTTVINKIIEVCQSTSIFKDTLADISIQELLVRIVQAQTLQGFQLGNNKKANEFLTQAISSISSNITSKIDLKAVARQVGMSPSSMYRMFKSELGISPVEFIVLERIKLAKQFLADKNIYIKNVSYEAGFEDSNYFTRVFKHYEGVTPRQYQQQMQQ